MIKRILVGIGGTPFSAVATKRAIELAQAHGAELTGITIVDLERLTRVGPVPVGGGKAARDLQEHRSRETRERVEKALGDFTSACEEAGVAHSVEREQGDPFDLCIAHARYHDLFVCGLRGLFDFGVVEEPQDAVNRLIYEGVRPIIAAAPEYRSVNKVLAAYSGSMESAKALRRFVQMRLWPEATIRVVCYEDDLHGKADELFADVERYCKAHGYAVETELQWGFASDRLLHYAESYGADLIVLGDSRRSVLMRKLCGDTTLHMIRNANRPLFLSH